MDTHRVDVVVPLLKIRGAAPFLQNSAITNHEVISLENLIVISKMPQNNSNCSEDRSLWTDDKIRCITDDYRNPN